MKRTLNSFANDRQPLHLTVSHFGVCIEEIVLQKKDYTNRIITAVRFGCESLISADAFVYLISTD